MFVEKEKICFYGTSIVGSSHIKNGTVCQDSHRISVLKNGWIVAAIADGVGSAIHSEIASKMAVDVAVSFFEERIDNATLLSDALELLPQAYANAENRIERFSEELGHSITEYDTTLSVVVYDGDNIVYGHSGDGGIVALTIEGLYVPITKPQKADDGICVIPLRAGANHWEFGIEHGKFVSVLLATDGVYDTFFPYLLKGQKNEVYVPLIRYFMDNNWLNISDDNFNDVKKSRLDFLDSDVYQPVTDDKTIVVLLNSTTKAEFQSEDYYKEPDWEALQLEWNKKAYPHLYADKLESGNSQ